MAEADSSGATTLVDLPPTIVLNILNRMPTLDAIRTTLLVSPKWVHLWSSLASLSFDYSLLPFITLQHFFNFITRTLLFRSRHSSLSSLSLRIPSDHHPDLLHRYNHHIDSYISYAVAHDVVSISLYFYTKRIQREEEEPVYDFPLFMLRNSSVKYLSLERCNITLTRSAKFETLTWVSLARIRLTNEMLADLIASCVNLENLELRVILGIIDFKISSTKLKKLRLNNVFCHEGSVEIYAPNLCKLSIFFFEVGRFVMENSSSLLEADVWFYMGTDGFGSWSQILKSLGNAKQLTIQNWGYQIYKAAAANDLFPEGFSFHNLNKLDLQSELTKSDILGMAALFERSPNLETLDCDSFRLRREEDDPEMLEAFRKVSFSLPSLRRLTVNCYWGLEDDICFVKLVIRDQVVLERIVLYTFPMYVEEKLVPPIIIVKQPQGFQVVQGSFPHLETT